MSTTLTVIDGRLTLDGDPLFYQVAGDDHGFINWPDPNPFHLMDALYAQGNINDKSPWGPILLPDGVLFGELVPCGFNLAEAWEPKVKVLQDEHKRIRDAARDW